MSETIVGLATNNGNISIIRVSGDKSFEIVNSIFSNKSIKESHKIYYGYILEHKKQIDEVLVTYMKAPKTYTVEDVVEINCHGGKAITKKIIEILLKKECRLAEPGEFTKRAFLNGRINLIEAEAIIGLVKAQTEKAHDLAINQLKGLVTDKIKDLRQNILTICANIEVNIDYPEYTDIEEVTIDMLKDKIIEIKSSALNITKNNIKGKMIEEGIKTAIIGKPNVGKSSILNYLIKEDKAIVTEHEGTTRDIVEGTLSVKGYLLKLLDTAGIRKTNDVIENIGINKSLETLKTADIILYVIDNNQKIDNEDLEILKEIDKQKLLIIINKIDLESKINFDLIKEYQFVKVSVEQEKGFDTLENQIINLCDLNDEEELIMLSSLRTIDIMNKILEIIQDIEISINNNYPLDIIEIDLKKIWEELGNIIGENYQEEFINQMFSQFCLGK